MGALLAQLRARDRVPHRDARHLAAMDQDLRRSEVPIRVPDRDRDVPSEGLVAIPGAKPVADGERGGRRIRDLGRRRRRARDRAAPLHAAPSRRLSTLARLAIGLHLFTPLRRAVYPLLIGSQTIPIVVLAPILVILLGYGLLPKVVIVALICFFPIVVNGLDGLRLVDDDFIRMMRTLDATRWSIFRKVEFPGALPSIFSGMRVAATFAAIGAVFGEWAGSSQGLGYLIQASTPNLQTARIFAAILLLTLIAMALFGLVSLLERIFCPWVSRGGAL